MAKKAPTKKKESESFVQRLLSMGIGAGLAHVLNFFAETGEKPAPGTMPPTDLIFVNSTVMSHIKYDFDEEVLTIVFHTGNMYDYEVPTGIFIGLLNATSCGVYFNSAIRGFWEWNGPY